MHQYGRGSNASLAASDTVIIFLAPVFCELLHLASDVIGIYPKFLPRAKTGGGFFNSEKDKEGGGLRQITHASHTSVTPHAVCRAAKTQKCLFASQAIKTFREE